MLFKRGMMKATDVTTDTCHLVLKKFRGTLLLCDRESGKPLSGQTDLYISSCIGQSANVVVTFTLCSDGVSLEES